MLKPSLVFITLIATSFNSVQAVEKAVTADLINKAGKKVGTVTLKQENRGGVTVGVNAKGLIPGLHGMHFHETAKCDGPSFDSAGSHFNPDHTAHGNMHTASHVGDLDNLPVKADGKVDFETYNSKASLSADATNSLLKGSGTALIIHAKPDDQYTQDSGNSDERIACAVISKNMVREVKQQ